MASTSLQPRTIFRVFEESAERYGDRPFLGTRTSSAYHFGTYADARNAAKHIAAVLAGPLGLHRGMRVALCSVNTGRYIEVIYACTSLGLPIVPVHTVFESDAIEYMLEHSEISVVFCSADRLRMVLRAVGAAPAGLVRHVVVMDSPTEHVPSHAHGATVTTLAALLRDTPMDPRLPFPREAVAEDDIYLILYTSGSTGRPKGVQISHAAFHFQAEVYGTPEPGTPPADNADESQWPRFFHTDVHLSFNPLAHAIESIYLMAVVRSGASIGFYSGSIATLEGDIRALHPTLFVSTPRIYNTFYERYLESYASFDPSVVTEDERQRRAMDATRPILGDRIRLIISGGAPLSPAVHEYLRRCFRCRVLQTYGLTETGVATVGDEIDAIGAPVPGLDFKLAPVPSMDHDGVSSGELCFRGPPVFKGYLKADDKTRECMEGDWFHTGDVGVILPSGNIRIVDRIKNLFKLSQGEYISAERLENIYLRSPFVSQNFVHGHTSEDCVVSIVHPNEVNLRRWFAREFPSEEAPSLAGLCADSRCVRAVMQDLQRVAREAEMEPYEVVRRIRLVPEAFSVTNNLLTPSFKINRPECIKRYNGEVGQLYAEMREVRKRSRASIAFGAVSEGDALPLVRHAFACTLGLEHDSDVDVEKSFFALGGDSVAATTLAALLSASFPQAHIAAVRVWEAPTVVAMSRLVASLSSGMPHAPTATEVTLAHLHGVAEREASALVEVQEPVHKRRRVDATESASEGSILLTGATGFVGAFTLAALLSTEGPRIYCLVRAKSDADALGRLEKTLAGYGIGAGDALRQRVVALAGDVSLERFGLTPDAYAALSASVDRIVHLAAEVNLVRPYATLEKANVQGTCHVLRFALSDGRRRRVHYTSTIAAFSGYPAGDIYENDTCTRHVAVPWNGYAQSKLVGELVCWRVARETALPISIHRLGEITAHTTTHASNSADSFRRILKTVRECGQAPDLSSSEASALGSVPFADMTPVDYCAAALAHFVQSESVGEGTGVPSVHHIVNPRPITWHDAFAVVLGGGVGDGPVLVPLENWCVGGTEGSAAGTKEVELARFFFAGTKAERVYRVCVGSGDGDALARAGVPFPSLGAAYYRAAVIE